MFFFTPPREEMRIIDGVKLITLIPIKYLCCNTQGTWIRCDSFLQSPLMCSSTCGRKVALNKSERDISLCVSNDAKESWNWILWMQEIMDLGLEDANKYQWCTASSLEEEVPFFPNRAEGPPRHLGSGLQCPLSPTHSCKKSQLRDSGPTTGSFSFHGEGSSLGAACDSKRVEGNPAGPLSVSISLGSNKWNYSAQKHF